MRQRVFDETKLTVSAGIAANKVCLQYFPSLTNDLISIAAIPDASQSMPFIRLSTRTHSHCTRSMTQICSDKVRMIIFILSPVS